MPTRSLLTALAALAVLTSSVGAASAQSLDEARAAYERGALSEARALYERLLAAGRSGPEEVAEAHLRLGILHAASGEESGARASFAAALAVDPSMATPDELPPEHAAWLEDARRTEALAVRAELAGEREVRVSASGGPAGMLARVRVAGAEWSATVEGASGVLPVPEREWRGDVIALRLEALDAAGNVLARRSAELRREAEAPVVASGAATSVASVDAAAALAAAAEEPQEDVAASPWLWLGVGAGVLVVAGAIVIGVLVADAQHPGFGAPGIVD